MAFIKRRAGRRQHSGAAGTLGILKIPKKPPVQNRGLLGGDKKTLGRGTCGFSARDQGLLSCEIACIIVPLSATSKSGR